MLHFFGLQPMMIALSLLAANAILRVGSYIFDYEDGISIFNVGYFWSFIFLSIVWFLLSANLSEFFDMFCVVWIWTFALIWFVVFVISLSKKVSKYMWYMFFVSLIWWIFLIITKEIQNVALSVLISSIWLLIIHIWLYRISLKQPLSKEKNENISVRRILAGERILEHKPYFQNWWRKEIYEFVINMPWFAKYTLEFLNMFLVVILIIFYLYHAASIQTLFYQIVYWMAIVVFVVNVILSKKLWYSSMIQRLVVFIVINFAIYIWLMALFGDISAVAWWWVVWNIISWVMIFYSPKSLIWKIFNKTDYVYWLITILIVMIANIVLLGKTDMPGQLLFFVILLYLGLQGMILFYAIRYIKKLEMVKIF